MSCFYPLRAWRAPGRTKNGKRRVVFQRREGVEGSEFSLPCGRCIGCRIDRAKDWAVRCYYESKMHDRNCFITLTYNEDNLPEDGSLCLRHFQLFMKRLRRKYGEGIRFFGCGEYGDENARPHYHACLFNHDFEDRVLWRVVREQKVYRSKSLEDLWEKGFCTVGDVTMESAAYVARYIMKKILGKEAESWYRGLKPEYSTMSRKEGIGKSWFMKYKNDVYPSDEVVVEGGVCMLPPKFFDGLLEKENMEVYEKVKSDRVPKGKNRIKWLLENDSFRLPVREAVLKSRLSNFKRNLEV